MDRFMLVFKSCIFVLLFIQDADSFNVDTKFPMIYSGEQNGSYFGYTVVLHTPAGETSSRLHVGAPRGKVDRRSSGNFYECVVGEPCQLQQARGLAHQDGDWMGVAMDVQQVGACNQLLVCSHRWYEPKNSFSTYFMAGACYWRSTKYPNTRSSENWMQPIYNTDRSQTKYIANNVYDWHIGEAGMSVHFTLPNPGYVSSPEWQTSHAQEDLLIGAPGILNWGGGVITCQEDRCGNSRQCVVPSMATIAGYFDYTGYQVNSGRFFKADELVYVASAPRAQKNKGRVILLRAVVLPRSGEKRWDLISSEVGSNIGEYFGASLAVGDFNGDKLDDLIVGSPLRFTDHDEGCINLYYGNTNRDSRALLRRFDQLRSICGVARGARFGTTLMTLGDLDKDGYVDLAVGAPYENDNRGAVYIYNGGPNGLSAEFSQRIAAEDVDGGLRGFGISIARPVDVDDNKYVDLAIGSYISGNVIVLRSHPVVQLILTIKTNIKKISQDTASFILTVCMDYEGDDRPQDIPVRRTIRLVDEYRRASFASDNTVIHNAVVTLAGESCDDLQVLVLEKNIPSGNLGAIDIRMNASLAYEDIPGEKVVISETSVAHPTNGFCKTCAVLDKDQLNPVETHRLEFAVDCGDDNICNSELNLQFSFIGISSHEYVIGSASKPELLIEVRNDGETAYGVQINIIIPSPVQVAQVPSNCYASDKPNSTESTLTCDVDRPLTQGRSATVTVSLDMRAVTSDGKTDKLDFGLSASTRSVDTNQDENSKIVLTLNLRSDADIALTGKAVERTYYYGKMNSSVIEFTHEYYIEKFGTSPIEKVGITIMIPHRMLVPNSNEEITFLEIYEPMGIEQGYEPLNCNSEFESYLKVTSDQSEFSPDFEDTTTTDELPVLKREKRSEDRNDENIKIQEPSLNFPTNRTFFINCSMPNKIYCKNIICKTRPLQLGQSNVRLSITMQLNMSGLERYLDKKDIIQLGTQGYVKIEQPANIEALGAVNKHPDSAAVATIFLGRVIKEKVADWVIALSVGGGLLFLCFVIMGLVKAGFFERKKKEELKALISADSDERAFAEARLSVLEALSEDG